MRVMTRIHYTILMLLWAGTTLWAQDKPVQASIDSTKIKIGSQFHLTLKATAEKGSKISFPEGKSFGQLEVLESVPIDTIEKGTMYELVKKYGLTQFDPGKYIIPKLPVIVKNKTIQTEELTIEVTDVKVDTLKQKMYDIKPVAEASSRSWLWLFILLGIAFWAVVGYYIYKYAKNRKSKAPIVPEENLTPLERAERGFATLKNKDLIRKGEVKEYYSELADIARAYLEETLRIPAMESTSGQLVNIMRDAVRQKEMRMGGEVFENFEAVLRNADMAKFALSRPPETEILRDRDRIEEIIRSVEAALPEEKEEPEITEEQAALLLEQQQLKKKKQRRVLITAGIAVLILGTGVYISFTRGVDYLKDNLIGHPTKELLDAEWVKSEYGIPPITIETPKVLKRVELNGKFTKEQMQNINQMQIFEYGSLFDNFHIALVTTTYKQQAQIDPAAAFDATAKAWEAQGASTILVKQDEFRTEDGVEGIRAYGTMMLPDPITKERKKSYYEILYFAQGQGLQQVAILHEDGDKYADKIVERIKKSVTFNQKKEK